MVIKQHPSLTKDQKKKKTMMRSKGPWSEDTYKHMMHIGEFEIRNQDLKVGRVCLST
jgi:hypothetical protein